MIESNLPITSPIPVLPAEHLKVYRNIELCRGRSNGILSSLVADYSGMSDREVRKLVKELVEVYGVAIGSGPTGFFIPETAEEVRQIRRALLSRAYSLLKRVAALDKNSDLAGILGQLQLAQEA